MKYKKKFFLAKILKKVLIISQKKLLDSEIWDYGILAFFFLAHSFMTNFDKKKKTSRNGNIEKTLIFLKGHSKSQKMTFLYKKSTLINFCLKSNQINIKYDLRGH